MKKGFTLIELLAVILILGIIALIAIPQVTNVISNASKGASETTGEHYIGAVNTTIGLNKLDTDSSNDIKDGFVDISTIEVNMTGEVPTSGTIYVKNGTVVEANIETSNHKLYCNSKGKCEAYDSYVYFNDKSDGLTDVKDGLTERPGRVYLKYPVLNGKLQTPKACVYNDVEELCLNPNEEEISTEKILDYYGFTKSVFETRKDNGIVKTYNQDNTKLCQVFYQNGQYQNIVCIDSNLSISSSVMNHTMVLVIDDNAHGQWGINGNGDSYFLDV